MKRLRAKLLTAEFLEKTISGMDGVPEGVEIKSITWDALRNSFICVLEHDSFPEHFEGYVIELF